MIKINRKVEYSLIALKHMASKKPGEKSTAREIASEYQIPFDTTAKILQKLHGHKILDSEQGVQGGYFLKKSLADISFADLDEMVEGKSSVVDCLVENKDCAQLPYCNIVTPLILLDKKIKSFLQELSLADLLLGAKKL
jgi:Rrf2 family nitric oxide-sensitive transcriptional repressor